MNKYQVVEKAQWARGRAVQIKNKQTINGQDIHDLAEAVRVLALAVEEMTH